MKTIPTNKLLLAVWLYRNLTQQSFVEEDSTSFTGVLPASYDFAHIESCIENAEMLGSSDVSKRSLEIYPRKGFYRSWSTFLRNINNRTTKPTKSFYLVDTDYLFQPAEIDDTLPIVKNYLNAIELFIMLKTIADYDDTFGDATKLNLVFCNKDKLIITSDYDETHLSQEIDLTDFKLNFIDSEVHKEQKKTILKNTLFEIFGKKGTIPFSDILIRYSEFVKQLHDNYDLYVSEFSFQKVKNEVEKEKLEFIGKINKVFSDMQNQLIAFPLALIIAGGQFQTDNNIKNLTIWTGAIVFCIFICFLIRNQKNTLNALSQEVNMQHKTIKEKYTLIADKLNDIYSTLINRIKQQNTQLDIVLFIIILLAIGITILLMIYGGYTFIYTKIVSTMIYFSQK